MHQRSSAAEIEPYSQPSPRPPGMGFRYILFRTTTANHYSGDYHLGNMPSEPSATLLAALAGLSTHALVKRVEPSVLQTFVFLLGGGISVFAYFLHEGDNALGAPRSTLRCVSAYVTSLVVSIAIYCLAPWHPLSSYPGPALAKVTKWWMAVWIAKGNRHLKLQELHRRYGPWVRIGPNEISINVPEAIRLVYGSMFRAPFYQGAPQDADALITTTSRKEHDERLIGWSKAFSGDMIQNYRLLTQERTAQLVDILRNESNSGRQISLSHWISLWAMDVMGDMAFSGGFETMAAGMDKEGWMEILSIGVLFVGVLGQAPWMRDIIALLPQPGPIMSFQHFAGKKVQETKSRGAGIKKDILGIIQEEHVGAPVLTTKQAAADASFIVVAGTDTVAQALVALFRYIIGDKQVQARLLAELMPITTAGPEHLDIQELSRLPYLDACVQEVLRLVPPAPRYSGEQGYDIIGHFIPPHTTVACPTYALRRDPENFKEPDVFMPERWLPGSNIEPHNRTAFVPFCYGPGVCIGKQVALQNMKIFVAFMLSSFELTFPASFDLLKYDTSYKEHNLWLHDSLDVVLDARKV